VLAPSCQESGIDAHRLLAVLLSAWGWLDSLRDESQTAEALSELVERVELGRNGIKNHVGDWRLRGRRRFARRGRNQRSGSAV
jgi:hypothetical protein